MVPSDRIRNVVLLGHRGAGKTTLAEALLALAGAVTRPGRVDDGTSVLDCEPEEIARRSTLSLSLAPFAWTTQDGSIHQVNLIDTPGDPDFASQVHAAMSVADLAIIVVSAVDGVEVQTEMLWREAVERGLPRLVFVSKEDKDRADFRSVLAQLTSAFGRSVIPVELPLGEEADLHGVADVLTESAYEQVDGHQRVEALPADTIDEERTLRDAALDAIVTGDDDQLERYLGGETLSPTELGRTLATEVLGGVVTPVLLGSATTGVGLARLADLMCELGPRPLDRPVTVLKDGEPCVVSADPDGPTLLHVFATVTDPYVGQLSVFKVLSGDLAPDARLVNTRTTHEERLHTLLRLRGAQQCDVDHLVAGDIGAVARLNDTRTGDVLAPAADVTLPGSAVGLSGGFALALEPRTDGDDDRLGQALGRLVLEDPALTIERVDETGQTLLRGTGETHLAVAVERLARKFGVAVDTAEVRLPYRETVSGSALAEGRLKKQTGGHGQFAVVVLRVSPGPRGSGITVTDSVVGGAIPKNYLPAVHKGIHERAAAGGVHGFPVVDVAVECIDGKAHAVDSSEMAFATAAAMAFTAALQDAGPVVLEPVSAVEVRTPSDALGDVMADLTGRRGRVQASDALPGDVHRIIALVPTAELGRYAVDLRSLTGGRGSFDVRHDHDDEMPLHLVDRRLR